MSLVRMKLVPRFVGKSGFVGVVEMRTQNLVDSELTWPTALVHIDCFKEDVELHEKLSSCEVVTVELNVVEKGKE